MQTLTTFSPTYNLAFFSRLSAERSNEVFNCTEKDNFYWLTTILGELGEVAEIVKKLDRGFNERELKKVQDKFVAENPGEEIPSNRMLGLFWYSTLQDKLSHELADVFIYLDLLCTQNNINLWEGIQQKFNQVSDEMKCPQFKI